MGFVASVFVRYWLHPISGLLLRFVSRYCLEDAVSRAKVAVIAAAVLSVAVILTLAYLAGARDRGLAGSIIQAVAATITLAGVCGSALWRYTRGHSRTTPVDVEEHLDRLAEAVTRQWERAELERGLRYPAAVSMQWRWSTRGIATSAEDATGSPSRTRTAPLPGTARATTSDLRGGDLDDLFRVYAGLDSGRVLLTGLAGSGKSSAGILLLLQALRHRTALEGRDRARTPVPVILSFYGWDPRRQDFAEWLTDRLLGDYPVLAAVGRTTVTSFVRDGRIAIFLDGLDEIPEDLRALVVRAIDHQVTIRIVLMSRVGEMAHTTQTAYLSGAASLELLPVGPDQAAAYLRRVSVSPMRPGCRAVVDRLTQNPDGPLARAVAQPLMLALLRDRLAADDNVHDLLAIDHADDAAAIEESLLDRVVDLAYRSAGPVSGTAARVLLDFLAANLSRRGIREFAWWDMPRWLPPAPRTLATAVLVAVVWSATLGVVIAVQFLVVGPVEAGFESAVDVLLGVSMTTPPVAMYAVLAVAQPGWDASLRSRAAYSRTVVRYGCVCGAVTTILVFKESGVTYALCDAAGSAIFVLLMAKRPSLRWASGRLRTTVSNPATLSAPVGACATFLGYFVRYLPEGVIPALGGTIMPTLEVGLLFYYLRAPHSATLAKLADSPRRNITGPATLAVCVFGAATFGLWTMLVLDDARTGDVASRVMLALAAVAGFLLIMGLTVGLLPRRDLSVNSVPAGPLYLMRKEIRARVAGGCVLAILLCLSVVPQAATFVPPPGIPIPGWAMNLLLAISNMFPYVVGGILFAVISSHTWQTILLGLQLRAAGLGPWRLPRYLDDAHRRGVLRALGPVYQFRHARLQDRLSRPAATAAAPLPRAKQKSLGQVYPTSGEQRLEHRPHGSRSSDLANW
jgi:hypothetical protein